MIKRFTALVLALLLVGTLAACSAVVEDSSASLFTLQDPEPPASDNSEDEPEPEPELPVPVVSNQAFLTGLPKAVDYPQDKRITAVMVNNVAASRPIRGLSDAKIVTEIKVEGGITRFMALYEDYEKMPEVGSVRSARDQFFQLLLPFWGFYIHEGPHEAEHPMNRMLDEYQYREFDLQPVTGSASYQDREGYTKKEYTLYTDGAQVKKAIENTSASDYREYGKTIFSFLQQEDGPRVPYKGIAREVAVLHSANYRTLFEYDYTAKRYKMSMFNEVNGEVEPTIDENDDAQLAFDNLIVLFAPMKNYADSELVHVDYGDGGGGYYFSQGHYEPLIWRKGAPNEPLLLYQMGGSTEMVPINPGTTYLAVVDDSELPEFDQVLQSGDAGKAVGEGELNPNREEPAD